VTGLLRNIFGETARKKGNKTRLRTRRERVRGEGKLRRRIRAGLSSLGWFLREKKNGREREQKRLQ